jgi:hypothetical protein
MSGPHACPDCLRRAALLGELGPDLERLLIAEGGKLSLLSLLGLPSDELAARVAPERAPTLIAALQREDFGVDLDAWGCWQLVVTTSSIRRLFAILNRLLLRWWVRVTRSCSLPTGQAGRWPSSAPAA